MRGKTLLCIATLTASAGAAQASTNNSYLWSINRVLNGNFETEGDPGRPAAWSYNPSMTSWSNASAVSGSYSIEINDIDPGGTTEWRSDPIDVSAGELLNFSFFREFDSVTPENYGGFIRYWDDTAAFQGQDLMLWDGTESWGYRELKSFVPANATKADVFFFTNNGVNTGLTRIDDVAVSDNLLFNAGFEEGSGGIANDWFTGGGARTAMGGAPSGFNGFVLDDSSTTGGADLRSRAVPLFGATELTFAFEGQRSNNTGPMTAFVRFFDDAGATSWIGQEFFDFSGDTMGWESFVATMDVPAGALTADIVFWTNGDLNTTGQYLFDDVVLSPTIVPAPGTLLCLAGFAAMRRRR